MTDPASLTSIERRRFLRHTWTGVGASLALALVPGRDLFAAPRFGTNPFALGVASRAFDARRAAAYQAYYEHMPIRASVSGKYTMLGERQERRVARGFRQSDAIWNIVGQQLLIAELEHATMTRTAELFQGDGHPPPDAPRSAVRHQRGEPGGTGYDEASWIVENGVPGAQPA
jgi:phosphodiesterase/alkaline phosphatase D-like protein